MLGQPAEFKVALTIAVCTPIFQVGLTDALTGVLRAMNHVRDLAFILAITAVIRLTCTWLGLEFFAAGINEVLFISAASLAIGAIAYFVVTLLRLSKETTIDLSVIKINQFIRKHRPALFIRRNYFINLLSLPTKDLDTFVLGMFATLDSIGIYRVAKNFVNVIWAISDPLHLVIYPELARLWNTNTRGEIRQFLRTISAGLIVMTFAVVVIGYVAVPMVIERLVGPEFEDSGRLFLIMMASVVIWLPLVWVHPIFLASGRNELSLRAAIIHSFVSAGLYISFGYIATTTGIAIAYSLSLALISLLQVYFLLQARLLAR
jgi:O-antigen/teichoic acid export membrane protein